MNFPFFRTASQLVHDNFFNNLRKKEYARLSINQHTYLDYTGGNLYAKSQIEKHHQLLNQQVFGNPHSSNPTSKYATDLVNETRQRVLDFFNADDYYCIFTANASAALKIVGECYPHSRDSHYLYLADNHNSVNGIREYAIEKGASCSPAKINFEDLTINESLLFDDLSRHAKAPNKLFAYPGQSNASGVKHHLKWVTIAQKMGWDVLLDAAALVPSTQLDLKFVQPDFVSISFYKIFGYPTGMGCLLVKKSSFHKLDKKWFAGGTVKYASIGTEEHILENDFHRFENGTINYLDIPAIKIGLDYISSIGMKRITERVTSMNHYLNSRLRDIKHDNGTPLLKIFGPQDRKDAGGNFIMTFINPDDSTIPFEKVEELANKQMISLRTGCFCNPGVDEVNNCVSNEMMASYFSSNDSKHVEEIIDGLKKIRGAVRISVGIATTKKDLDTYIAFVQSLKNKQFSPHISAPTKAKEYALPI